MGFGGGAIDFVDEGDLGENGAWKEDEALFFAIIDGISEDIGGEEIASELDPAEVEAEGGGEGLGEDGFSDAGEIFDEEMTACEDASDGEADGAFFSDNNFTNLGDERGALSVHEAKNLGLKLNGVEREVCWGLKSVAG